MSPRADGRVRYAVVGTGARAEMFVRALVLDHADTAELVAFADVNQARMDAHNRWLSELGHRPLPTYRAADFAAMLDKERVDVVLVTSVDVTHDEYVVAALRAGREVVTEKPMTVDAPRCRRILDAVRKTGGRVTVAFNYRYNPLHEQVRRLLAEGAVGEIGSVHFEWLLDVRHGADYFRRWHRDKATSGGLMVHKASHHFDLVNWWLAATPSRCTRPAGSSSTARAAAGTATPATTTGRTAPPPPSTTRSRCGWTRTPDCVSCTSTPRPRTATSATATSSPPG